MALLMNKTGDNGIVTNYHKIASLSMNQGRVICMINSYVSEEYREAEKPADSSTAHLQISIEEEESMGIRQLCYKKIKELPNWAEATDC